MNFKFFLCFLTLVVIVKIFATNGSVFCNESSTFDALAINVVVFLVYTIRVVPEVFDSFYETIGDKNNVRSKLNSLRLICWLQGDDTLWMQLGFKLDRYMNGVYVAILNLNMLFILFLTNSTVNVILNALAIQFVSDFDEELSCNEWFDPACSSLHI